MMTVQWHDMIVLYARSEMGHPYLQNPGPNGENHQGLPTKFSVSLFLISKLPDFS